MKTNGGLTLGNPDCRDAGYGHSSTAQSSIAQACAGTPAWSSCDLVFDLGPALELEVLGKRPRAAGTAYSLLGASGNLPIAYMTWLDGVGYKHAGAPGMMSVDALANAGCVVLLLG